MRKLHGNPWAVLVVVPLGFFMTLLYKTFQVPNLQSASPQLMTYESAKEKL